MTGEERPFLCGPLEQPGEAGSRLVQTLRSLTLHTAADCGPPLAGSAWQQCAKECSHSETEEGTKPWDPTAEVMAGGHKRDLGLAHPLSKAVVIKENVLNDGNK